MITEALGSIPPLPTLVWKCILNCLRWDSRSTLQALCLTCHGFRRLALPALFETLHLHFLPKRDTGCQMLQDLQGAGDELLRCVRIFIVSGSFLYDPAQDTLSLLAPLLVSLVEKLPRLVVIRWRGRFLIPDGLLQHLNARQLVPSLYFEGWPYYLDVASFKDGLRCIRSLSVTSYAKGKLYGLKPVVLALPCLDRLHMKYLTRSEGDSGSPIFSFHPGESMPPLRTLCLTNFTVDSEGVDEWAQYHHLRHLGLDGGAESLQLLTLFTGRVPDMTSLTLRIRDGTSPDITDELYSRLDKFLPRVNALAAFTAYDLSKDILPLLVSRHGPHLRRLRFRQTNFNMRDQEQIRCLFTFEELQNLASVLPRLQRLGIDLRFKGHLSYDILSGVACFPSLEHLELNANFPYDECRMNGQALLVDSWLNAAVAEAAFRYVAEEKLSYGRIAGVAGSTTVPWSPFNALDIKVGEWEPSVEGYSKSVSPTNLIFLYSCRWLTRRPGKVDIVRLRCLAQQYPIEDDLYEQALARAGLWSVSKLLSGPGTL